MRVIARVLWADRTPLQRIEDEGRATLDDPFWQVRLGWSRKVWGPEGAPGPLKDTLLTTLRVIGSLQQRERQAGGG